MKALSIDVYRNGTYDCTNGGISSKYDELLLVCDEGYIEIDENNLPENLVKIVSEKLCGKDREYKYIEPYKAATKIGWMSGGNIAYSCDSRFSELSDYPLVIHDRQETPEQYARLSN